MDNIIRSFDWNVRVVLASFLIAAVRYLVRSDLQYIRTSGTEE